MANPIQDILKRSRQTWVLLAQSTIWIAGVIVGFLLPPPVGTPEESQVWVRFAQFVITIVIGMVLLGALRWKRKKDAFHWALISGAFLFLGTVTFFGYQILAARWTVPYKAKRVVIGESYTAYGSEYHKNHPELLPEALVMDVAGKVEKLWTRESLQERRLILAALYVLAMPLFTVCIMSIVQALHCAVAQPSRRRRPASAAARSAS